MPLLEYHQSHINYEFRDHPKGNHGTLVLLHGFLEDSRMWKELTPNLEHIGSILMIDLPGHGKTPSFGYVHTMDFMAGCVRAVLDHLDVTKCVLLGHSMGGYAALAFTHLYPNYLTGLGLFFSTPEADSPERVEMRFRAAELVKKNKSAFIRAAIPQLFDLDTRNSYKDEISSQIQESLTLETQGILASLMGMRSRPDRTSVLYDPPSQLVPSRIAVFAGEKDTVIPFQGVQGWWNAESVGFRYLSDHGHMGHISDSKRCGMAIAEWWQTLLP